MATWSSHSLSPHFISLIAGWVTICKFWKPICKIITLFSNNLVVGEEQLHVLTLLCCTFILNKVEWYQSTIAMFRNKIDKMWYIIDNRYSSLKIFGHNIHFIHKVLLLYLWLHKTLLFFHECLFPYPVSTKRKKR